MAARISLILILSLAPALQVRAQTEGEPVFRNAAIPKKHREAIERGLDYLAHVQTPHGSIGSEFTVASTSLSGLAFLASGSQYNRGRYGSELQKCVQFVVRQWQPGRGLFDIPRRSEKAALMHTQGYALLFLAEVYGMLPPEDRTELKLKEKIHESIRTVLKAQTKAGGWGYYDRAHSNWGMDEASTTVCQIQALRACRNAGISVSRDRIDRAVEYVRRCSTEDGSFRYQLGSSAPRTSYELTAAAVSTLNASGVYASEELDRGLAYLEKSLEAARKPADAAGAFYYYGNFYAAQAMHQAGGDLWRSFYPRVSENLVEKQTAEGRWENDRGDVYATAMALLVLEVPLQYLPIFQR